MKKKEWEKFERIYRSNINIINSLRDGDECYRTLLMYDVRYNDNDDDIFNYLINIPQDFAVVNGLGRNIVHYFAIKSIGVVGERKFVKLLQKANVDCLINIKDHDCGDTPLHLAAYKNNHKIIQQLISLGSDVNIKNNYNELPDKLSECDYKTRRLIREARVR